MNYMIEAINEAKKAYEKDEIPIGAVIVMNKKIIAKSHNMCECQNNPTMHAEINAINKACEVLNTKFLDECEMYVTVEPCPMCAGAIALSRIKRVFIGCDEPKTGALGSITDISKLLPYKAEIYHGFCEDECKELMKKFFLNKRSGL